MDMLMELVQSGSEDLSNLSDQDWNYVWEWVEWAFPSGPDTVPDIFSGAPVEVRNPSEETCGQWCKEAAAGVATSSSPPVEVHPICTPSPKQHLFFETDTPPKVAPHPTQKTDLTAQKRMELQIKNLEKLAKKGDASAIAELKKLRKSSGKKNEKKKSKVTEKKKDKKQKKTKQEPEKKKTKDMSNGPMQVAMAAFFRKEQKKKGYSYRVSQKAWMNSDERRAIIESMPMAERKKRRFA